MKRIIVNFYRSASGNEPVREWLKDLCKEDKVTIGEDIKTVEYGWPLGMPLVCKMDKDLWEVRSSVSSGTIARIFFTVCDDIMVLLHGIIKKTPKTPSKDLDIAKDRRNLVLTCRRVK